MTLTASWAPRTGLALLVDVIEEMQTKTLHRKPFQPDCLQCKWVQDLMHVLEDMQEREVALQIYFAEQKEQEDYLKVLDGEG